MNENNIVGFIHCKRCLDEWQEEKSIRTKISPKDYAKVQCGWTEKGLQVWCNRHDCNIMHLDFEGAKHEADLSVNNEGKKK